MWIHRNLIFLCVIIGFFPVSFLGSQENQTDTKDNRMRIEWREIPYAEEYVLQIRNDKKQNIIERKSKQNFLEVDLPPGKYEKRIGVINKFGRLERFSDWANLRILIVKEPTLPPAADPTKPRKTINQLAGESTTVSIEGKNFVPDTKFVFRKGNRSVPTEAELVDEKTAKVTIPEGYLEDGEWDLEIQNPRSKSITVPRFARVNDLTEKDTGSRDTETTTVSTPQEKSIEKTPSNTNQYAYLGDANRYSPVWRSAVLPGWGHFYMDNNQKGYIYSGVFTLGFLYLLQSRQNLIQTENTYRNGLAIGLGLQAASPGNVGIFALTNMQNESNFQEYRKANQNFNVAGFLLLGFYIYQLWDAYVDSEDWYSKRRSGWNLDGGNRLLAEDSMSITGINRSDLTSIWSTRSQGIKESQVESFWKLTYTWFLD